MDWRNPVPVRDLGLGTRPGLSAETALGEKSELSTEPGLGAGPG